MTDQAPELLPCPFCGNEAIVWPVVRPTCFQVGCKRCGGRSDGYPVASEAVAAWNTRPSSERPVAQEDRCPTCERTATEFRGYQPERCRDPWHKTSRPDPQVREANVKTMKGETRAEYNKRHRDYMRKRAARTARPSDAAVAWRYRHKDTEGWLMLKNGRDPTEWLKQWTNTEYEVEALAPMRPEAADEIERLRNQLVRVKAALNKPDLWVDRVQNALALLADDSDRAKLRRLADEFNSNLPDEQGGK